MRTARCADSRIYVVIHLFGGKRREHDFEAWLLALAQERGLTVLCWTVDWAQEDGWDLEDPRTQEELLRLADEGGIDPGHFLEQMCLPISECRHLGVLFVGFFRRQRWSPCSRRPRGVPREIRRSFL